jgi:asparagine synthase (glutamine-hydrolysing)
MCGIWAVFGKVAGDSKYVACINALTARGPEGKRQKILDKRAHLSFSRLAINGLTADGMQPFSFDKTHMVCNGEIYNWQALAEKYGLELKTGSDCEVLQLINRVHPYDLCNELDGVFAFAGYNEETNLGIIARDPFGVRPLYMWVGTINAEPVIAFSSEIKGFDVFKDEEGVYSPVPPGYYIAIEGVATPEMKLHIHQYHFLPPTAPLDVSISVDDANRDKETAAWCKLIRERVQAAVKKRVLNTERPIAALLSGGVDSSLISALVQRQLKEMGKPPLKTFSIGFEGSKDLEHARKVAEHIGSDHNEIMLSPDDFFNAIPEVIKAIESYDVTTVRASVGNYLVAKAIAASTDAKVVFNGDGADEAFGSYLYFYRAPSPEEYDQEVRRLLKDIHYFDVLRSDRSISSNGLEPRTPFLDKSVIEAVLSVPISLRKPRTDNKEHMEKALLRYAFFNPTDPILPEEVLFRRKEAFSDGVSGPERPWYEEIKMRLIISDGVTIPEGETAESMYYRQTYNQLYAHAKNVNCPYRWLPKWSDETTDPSARTLNIY